MGSSGSVLKRILLGDGVEGRAIRWGVAGEVSASCPDLEEVGGSHRGGLTVPELIHCRVKGCEATFRVKNFEDGMAKIRHHRRVKHPSRWKESVAKGVRTKKERKK